MRALVCEAYGPVENLKVADLAVPEPKAGEILVRVGAAGVSFAALLGMQGKHQNKPALPYVPGNEMAGHVVKLGPGVTNLTVGQRITTGVGQGAYAEYAVATAANAVAIPETMPYAQATNFPTLYPTAYGALKWKADMQPGEVLLVHGAGGGVGLAAVEIGKMLGATVIATASSDKKLAIAKARGADHLVRYDREPFRDAVKRITDGQGADVVFDPVGGEVFENSMRCINWGARLLVIGFTGGIGLAKTNLLMIKGATVLGVRAGEAVRRNPALGEVRIKALSEWAEAGKIRPNVSHRLPLENYAQAMRLLIDRKAIGRVALITRP